MLKYDRNIFVSVKTFNTQGWDDRTQICRQEQTFKSVKIRLCPTPWQFSFSQCC